MPDPTQEDVRAEEARVKAEHEAAEARRHVEKEEADAEAAFAAGFEGTPYTEATTETKSAPETSETAPEKPENTPGDQKTTADAPPPSVLLSKEQADQLLGLLSQHQELKESVTKQFGTAFGKMGGLERVLKDLQTSHPTGQPVKVSKEDLKELNESGFEELIDKLIPGLERALSKVNTAPIVTPTFDADSAKRLIEEERILEHTKVRQQCVEDLTELTPDWRTIVGDPKQPTPWRQWLQTQASRYQKKVNASWDADVVAESIERWKAETARTTNQAANVTKKSELSRKDELREGITKRASASRETVKSDEEEFNEGYMSGPAGVALKRK